MKYFVDNKEVSEEFVDEHFADLIECTTYGDAYRNEKRYVSRQTPVNTNESTEETTLNTEVARCIKSLGEDLISRAEDISNDLERVGSIDISARICSGEIINYDVTKNYKVMDYIDYEKIKNSKKDID